MQSVLSNGTALSRFHLNHRYSDDLDFVSHQDPYFGDYIEKITVSLKENHFEVKPYGVSSTFAALHLFDLNTEEKMKLKVDFINEKTVPHFGNFQYEKLSTIKWIQPVNVEDFKRDSQIIIENIITKSENKLYRK